MEDKKELFLKKILDHFESSQKSLQQLDFRDFASRFYYGYIFLLDVVGIKRRGGWHKLNSYSFPSKTFERVYEELRIWRNRADYEFHKDKSFSQDYEFHKDKSFSQFEEEFKEFLKNELIEHLNEEIKPLIENEKSLSLSVKLILLKKLEGIIKWLKIMI